MTLSIEDSATEKAISELAAATGETVATAVRRAAEERLERLRRRPVTGGLAAELLAIGRQCAALPDRDGRTPDQILGYDEQGLPS